MIICNKTPNAKWQDNINYDLGEPLCLLCEALPVTGQVVGYYYTEARREDTEVHRAIVISNFVLPLK